ncbi:TRIO and F-actin-binding protein, partial [Toxocara canis]
PFNIDTSNTHTLRKGWLMLRGKSESEWIKHWVVLAGLSLKLYKDVWAEDSSEPLLSIDLTECENVYPSASARNYGIEIKARLEFIALICAHSLGTNAEARFFGARSPLTSAPSFIQASRQVSFSCGV